MLGRLIARSRRSPFVRRLAVLLGGTAAGQLLMVLALPLLARLYAPEAFGLMAVFLAVVVPLNAVAAFRYELAVPLVDSLEEARGLVLLSTLLVVATSAVAALLVLGAGRSLAVLLRVPELAPYLWLLPVCLLGGGLFLVFSHYAVRLASFGTIAAANVRQAVAQTGSQIALGLVVPGAFGLLVGVAVRYLTGTVSVARRFFRDGGFPRLSPAQLWQLARRHRNYPLFSSGATFLQLAANHVPSLMLAFFYGPLVAGWFALGNRLFTAPINLLARTTAQVYLAELSERLRKRPATAGTLFHRTVTAQAVVAVALAGVLALPAPWTFTVIFGERWRPAGTYLQLMALMFVLQYLANTVTAETLTAAGRQRLHLVLESSRSLLVVTALVLAGATGQPAVSAVGLFAAVSAVSYLVYLLCARGALRHLAGSAVAQVGERPADAISPLERGTP